MTPMPANTDRKSADPAQATAASGPTRLKLVRDSSVADSSSRHSVFRKPSASIAPGPAAARLAGSSAEGTIGAAIAPVNRHSYSAESDALLSAVPVVGERHRPSTAPQVRATDLITELREISGQVNRMMSQVDRAIHRLGEHAGEPLRR